MHISGQCLPLCLSHGPSAPLEIANGDKLIAVGRRATIGGMKNGFWFIAAAGQRARRALRPKPRGPVHGAKHRKRMANVAAETFMNMRALYKEHGIHFWQWMLGKTV